MKVFIKPKPNEKFFKLSARQAAVEAMRIARQYSESDQPDWQIFKEFTEAHRNRNRGRQLTLA